MHYKKIILTPNTCSNIISIKNICLHNERDEKTMKHKQNVIFFKVLFVFISCIISFFIALCIFSSHTYTYNQPQYEKYIVSSGDTLWSIASQYCPEKKDKRIFIKTLKKLNNLTSSTIYPGNEIKIPVGEYAEK